MPGSARPKMSTPNTPVAGIWLVVRFQLVPVIGLLFARLMVEPDYVATRAAEDPILRAKVARLRELLVAFCPQFDDSSWPCRPLRVK